MKIKLITSENTQIYILEGSVIRIGRDPQKCHLIFPDSIQSVSRIHAEFRETNGRCIISDVGSTLGVYVDESKERLSLPVPVKAGSKILLGEGGPSLEILSLEFNGSSSNEMPKDDIRYSPPKLEFNEAKLKHDIAEDNYGKSPIKFAMPRVRQAYLELLDDDKAVKRFDIAKPKIIIGRDRGVDVVIESSDVNVSRKHAEINKNGDSYFLSDTGSYNGTLLNGKEISHDAELKSSDVIRLGRRGPDIRFTNPEEKSYNDSQLKISNKSSHGQGYSAPETIRVKQMEAQGLSKFKRTEDEVPVRFPFTQKNILSIGRADNNDIRLQGLQISKTHALVKVSYNGTEVIDNDSNNGVFVNGERIEKSQLVSPNDNIQIGPYTLRAIANEGVLVYDTRSKARIDVLNISKRVRNHSGQGEISLLDDISLCIQPNEFIGLLGPSGAGKSTFMDAINGMRPATDGEVRIKGLNLYQYLDSLKQDIGYVPQDDIIHRELTVERTLEYVARLRLSDDVSREEMDRIVNEVMDLTGLTERRKVKISQLSGGQRKRVSIAVELVTKPSVIFLDEPTSGLDPATEEKIMLLFRQIAESGRTVVLTTHAMENVKLFDKVVVLMQGKLIFYGTPQQALIHFNAKSFKEFYDKIEEPIEDKLESYKRECSDAHIASTEFQTHIAKMRQDLAEKVSTDWKNRFLSTVQYRENVVSPLRGIEQKKATPPVKKPKNIKDFFRQWITLSQRYMEVMKSDKSNLLILFGQAPIIAFLTYLVVAADYTRDFLFFMLALVAIWFGTSVSAREIIRERAVYNRERMVNLGLLPYIGSKLVVLTLIVGTQCVLLFLTLKIFHLLNLMKLPSVLLGVPHLIVLILTGIVGIALGLFISAFVKTSEMATSLVPLILIPQILFSGLIGVPEGMTKVVGLLMPATWSFDEMKRLSAGDVKVLRGKDENAQPASENNGRGLYKDVEHTNDMTMNSKKEEFDDYKVKAESKMKEFEKKMDAYQEDMEKYQHRQLNKEPVKPKPPKMDDPPERAEVRKIPDDLSDYVDFLHPWGGIVLNPLVLFIMFVGFISATVLTLRYQDIG